MTDSELVRRLRTGQPPHPSDVADRIDAMAAELREAVEIIQHAKRTMRRLDFNMAKKIEDFLTENAP